MSAAPSKLDSWVIARLLAGDQVNGERESVSSAFGRLVDHLAELSPECRKDALDGFVCGISDPDDFTLTIASGDPSGSPPEVPIKRRPANALDLRQSAEGVPWAWTKWICRGRLTGLVGFEGCGKTRLGLDLARRAYHGLPALDGQSLDLTTGAPSIWIAADGHQDELAATAKELGIPAEALRFNSDPSEP